MIAFLFGGQGSELPRIGAVLAGQGGRVADLVRMGGEAAGIDLPELLERGSPRLYRTEVLQPAMVAVGLAVAHRLAERGVRPGFVAGHSLGELTAWGASGAVDPEPIIAAAGLRGRLMARLAYAHPGGMLALECDEATCEEALRMGDEGHLALAARNAPRSWTLSGGKAALATVSARLPSKAVPVQGPWHSPFMAPAVEPLRAALRAIPRRSPMARFLGNGTGGEVADPASIPDLIAAQLVRPVLWMRTLETLSRLGARRFIAIGAGRFLRSLAGHTLGRDFPILTTETPSELERACEEMP